MSSELETLKSEWLKIDGAGMPDDIADQPIQIVRKAVHWRRQGIFVIIPQEPVSVPSAAEDSISDWDRQDDKNSNAYGS